LDSLYGAITGRKCSLWNDRLSDFVKLTRETFWSESNSILQCQLSTIQSACIWTAVQRGNLLEQVSHFGGYMFWRYADFSKRFLDACCHPTSNSPWNAGHVLEETILATYATPRRQRAVTTKAERQHKNVGEQPFTAYEILKRIHIGFDHVSEWYTGVVSIYYEIQPPLTLLMDTDDCLSLRHISALLFSLHRLQLNLSETHQQMIRSNRQQWLPNTGNMERNGNIFFWMNVFRRTQLVLSKLVAYFDNVAVGLPWNRVLYAVTQFHAHVLRHHRNQFGNQADTTSTNGMTEDDVIDQALGWDQMDLFELRSTVTRALDEIRVGTFTDPRTHEAKKALHDWMTTIFHLCHSHTKNDNPQSVLCVMEKSTGQFLESLRVSAEQLSNGGDKRRYESVIWQWFHLIEDIEDVL
jgi:hypothetical protein